MDPISLLALLVSVASLALSWRIGAQQTQLQARLVDVEAVREEDRLRETKRASLIASVVRQITPSSFPTARTLVDQLLCVANSGRAQARSITILLDGKPPSEHEFTSRNDAKLSVLGPGAEAKFYLSIPFGSSLLLHVELAWEDESAEPGRWVSELTL